MHRFILAAGAVVALAACHGGGQEAVEPRNLEPVEVQVTSAWTAGSQTNVPAQVVPLQEAEVATRMAGTIDRVAVDVGDRVAAGAVLARLDDSDVNARIAAARAQLQLAERTYTRMANLAADGAASQQEKDQAEAQLESARAMVEEAQAQASYVDIRAPFAGVVTARMADPGDLAAPGIPLVQLSGQGVKVVAELPANMAGAIQAGDAVRLEMDGGAVGGTVRNVVPALNRASRRFQVEVTPEPGADLMPGAFARLLLSGEADGATRWIPGDAVVRKGQLTGVFALEDDSLRLRWLRLGRTNDGAVEVLAGPAGELNVVRNATLELQDGQPVSRATAAPVAGDQAATDGQED